MKIEYPLNEDEKNKLRKRLNEVLDRTDGLQVIILWDKSSLSDYYQNVCIDHLISEIKGSAEEFKQITEGLLIT
ncbi:MAG: hypothetical protein V3W20_00585 [Candidatus Neomarinimicrobiota bacterium]